jgi:2-amino-4-hydroxy-6-hydroxymethyldihydropteridine diphosphokinase
LSIAPDTGVVAAIGLGGNLGDPRRAMATALQQFDARPDCRVLAVSKLYRTPPWGKTDQADFFNACALLEAQLQPTALLDLCLSIERGMKRVRIERWGPRTIDIDVLTYGDREIQVEGLDVPHPRMVERGFVLLPLVDIAAGMMVSGKTVADWADSADLAGIEIADDSRDWWR